MAANQGLGLGIASWPAADRAAWDRAAAPGSLLEPGGLAAGWRPATRQHVIGSYGSWLAWLKRQGQLEAAAEPVALCTPEAVAAYATELLERVALKTSAMRLVGLQRALVAMYPQQDWTFIYRLVARLPRDKAASSAKRARLRSPVELLALGRQRMAEAEADPSLRPVLRALAYRDGLLLAILATRPLRRRNLVGLELGRHLVRLDGIWWLLIPAEETKTGVPIEVVFPAGLVPELQTYLERHRPVLCRCNGASWPSDRGPLWLSRRGRPLQPHTLTVLVEQLTAKAFGQALGPHAFRDCVATTIAIEDPEHVRVAAMVLGHRTFATTQRHYNLARTLDAARVYQQALATRRRNTSR